MAGSCDKPVLIVNPKSANGATGRHFDAIARAVRSAVGEHEHAFTERPMHAAALARRALEAGSDLVIAAGGDGTINEIVNGFFAEARPGEPARPVRSGAALAILPHGTGGDFRRTLGLSADLERNAARLRGVAHPVDVGRADFVGPDGEPRSRFFLNVADAGVGARVVELANASTKALGGKLSFLFASARALAGWRDVAVRYALDDQAPIEASITTFAVANGRFFGGGMMVAPEARIDDGLFHVTIWSGYGLSDFVLKSGSMYDGSHVRMRGTRTATARVVRLEPGERAQGPVGLEMDGDLVGKLPATLTVLPGALRVVC